MKRVTINDVAKHVGVSPTAVSFAFNNPSQLNPTTVEQILTAARELGYSPNPHARALLSRKVGVLGVLVPQALFAIYANPFFSTFFQGIGSLCDEERLGLLTVAPLGGSLSSAIARAPADGFIIVGLNETHTEVATLLKRQVPFVIVDGYATTALSVSVDDEGGAYAAAAHLLDHGQRDILILALKVTPSEFNSLDYSPGPRRLRGYRKAFIDRNAPWRPDWTVPCISSIEDGEQAFRSAWASGLRPTAVLAMSDAIAIGAIRSAQRLGLGLPDDLSVIGYDDIPLAALVSPQLSTIRQPIFEKGRLAAEMLVATLEGNTGLESARLPTELVLRETTPA